MRLAILGSTRGTHLPALIAGLKALPNNPFIALVLSNKQEALLLEKAKAAHIPALFVDPKEHTREAYDALLTALLESYEVEGIVLLGYMRLLSANFVKRWAPWVMNVHPSLLPAHAGLMDLAVHASVLASGDLETGCTVHEVVAEVDAGPILVQKSCPVFKEDTKETLKTRVQALEVPALLAAIATWASSYRDTTQA